MPDLKISAATAATAFLDADEFPVNEAGTSKKVTGTLLKAWTGDMVRNVYSDSGISGQNPAAATRTYITNSNIAVPTAGLVAGTFFKWSFNMVKTAAGSAASTFDICFGTAGTTADTARVSFTKLAGTAASDEAWVTIDAVVGSVGAGAGRVHGTFVLVHNGNTVGHATIPVIVAHIASALFTNNTAGLIVGLCITSGAADAITINQVTAQAFNL